MRIKHPFAGISYHNWPQYLRRWGSVRIDYCIVVIIVKNMRPNESISNAKCNDVKFGFI